MDTDIITSYASDIGGKAFAIIYGNIRLWLEEFQILQKRQIPQSGLDLMILEGSYLSHFIAIQKSKNILQKDVVGLFESDFRYAMVVALAAYYDSPKKDEDILSHIKTIEQLYDAFLNDRISAYGNSQVRIVKLFRAFIVQNAFNRNNNVDIKFIELNFIDKLKFKFYQSLSSVTGNSELTKETYLDVAFLDSLIMDIWNDLMNIDADSIYSQYKN